MTIRHTALAIVAAAGIVPAAHAQVTTLNNPGFETPSSNSANGLRLAKFWRHFNTANRRYMGDGFSPAPVARTGIASMGVAPGTIGSPGETFAGFDTNQFDSGLGLYNDPLYSPNCGPVTWSAWINIPDSNPLRYSRVGLKYEFRRSNSSVYEAFENLFIGPEYNNGQGDTNGQWVQLVYTLTNADFQYKFNFYNDQPPYDGLGLPWPDPPITASLVHLRFGTPPMGQLETGYVFYDDITFSQPAETAASPIEFWDDTFMKGIAVQNAGVQEPSVPVFLNNVRVGANCLAGNESYDIVEIYDEVPNTGSFPLTFADIVANNYIRPLVQQAGGGSAIGTSIVTGPSYRVQGGGFRFIPTISRADVTASIGATDRDLNADPPRLGSPIRTPNFKVQTTGALPEATLISRRDYGTDPVVGLSTVIVDYTFTVTSNITLDPSPTGRGFDAFRLFTISSMLANIGLGQYDARFIAVDNGSGQTRTLAIDDQPRNRHLFTTPAPLAVGGSVTLFQDNDATFNPGSPSIEVELTSISGAPGALGVQGFLASSTDPNDDSLNAWIEWVGAPAVIPAGTTINVTLVLRATAPTDVGDVNHSGVTDCTDVAALVALCGQNESSATFNAYADLNGDGVINATDRTALEVITGTCPVSGCNAPPACPGDANNDGSVNFSDITSVLQNFNNVYTPGTGPGDANLDGSVNFSDITSILQNFNTTCS
ncbi:MAG: dockerin type I domain-containing protein [Planctomycetota bacterium]|nr:dockerin type I domain-containing protein [Planctomycetota bacterium]